MTQSTLAQKAYRHLQEGILSGKLSPGSVVSESRLAKELGVSRTPIGEAIRQLAKEGLVRQVPRYGTIVREFKPRDVEELYEMREALEGYAAGQAARRITSLQLAQLEALCTNIEQILAELESKQLTKVDMPTLRRFLAADLAFHLLIVRAAGNQRILQTIHETRTVSQIFRMRRREPDQSVIQLASQMHRRILEALASGNAAEASARMAEHIRVSRDETLAYLTKEQQQSSSEAAMIFELPDVVGRELIRIEEEGFSDSIQ